ncbi:hypothetical protein HUN58_16895 [Curtobacterium sp. Csp1]|uniref:hypothetical protein n=1 Tax=Curtobacterium sp. Csp1 TaxID=2495429 RepID=UPI001599FFE7|nr:hypothetical protein [Curtobacterium sp. Csp1]QKS21390.1 hypothetical protein HUN58_16895 [Curtobacterium sp. Csp1]
MGAASSGSGSSAKNIIRSPHHDELETTSDDGRGAAPSALGGGRTSDARCIFWRGAMNDDRRPLSRDALEQAMAMIEKGQQLAGHFPDAEALGRARHPRRLADVRRSGGAARSEVRLPRAPTATVYAAEPR